VWSDEWLECSLNPAPVALASLRKQEPIPPQNLSDGALFFIVVTGQEALHHIWCIADRETLYIDKNGDGRLSEQESERLFDRMLERDTPWTKKVATDDFSLPETPGRRGYPSMRVRITWVDPRWGTTQKDLGDFLAAAQTLEDPHLVWIDLTMRDTCRQLAVTVGGKTAESAPVLHFDGPLTLGLSGLESSLSSPRLRRGKEIPKLRIGVGTPGVGRGSFVRTTYFEIPKSLRPSGVIEYLGFSGWWEKPHSVQLLHLTGKC
jgi:hypothetical protein